MGAAGGRAASPFPGQRWRRRGRRKGREALPAEVRGGGPARPGPAAAGNGAPLSVTGLRRAAPGPVPAAGGVWGLPARCGGQPSHRRRPEARPSREVAASRVPGRWFCRHGDAITPLRFYVFFWAVRCYFFARAPPEAYDFAGIYGGSNISGKKASSSLSSLRADTGTWQELRICAGSSFCLLLIIFF